MDKKDKKDKKDKSLTADKIYPSYLSYQRSAYLLLLRISIARYIACLIASGSAIFLFAMS